MKFKKSIIILLFLFSIIDTFSQTRSGFLGGIMSVGVDYSLANSKNFIKKNSSDNFLIKKNTFQMIGPTARLHFNIMNFSTKDLLFLNLNLTYLTFISSTSSAKTVGEFNPILEAGFTYLGGNPDGKAILAGVLISTGNSDFGNIVAPTIYCGYQFQMSDRVFQVFAKNTINIGKYKETQGGFEKNSTNLFSIGITYSGIIH